MQIIEKKKGPAPPPPSNAVTPPQNTPKELDITSNAEDSNQKAVPVAVSNKKTPVTPPSPIKAGTAIKTADPSPPVKMPNRNVESKTNDTVPAHETPNDDVKSKETSDIANIIAIGNVEQTADMTDKALTNVSSRIDNKLNTSMITINSDIAEQPNSLSSNVSQVTVVTSHPPVLVDNSPSPGVNEVIIVSNETNKTLHVNESSTDDDLPSLDSLECSSSRHNKQHGQKTIIISDTNAVERVPSKNKKQWARKLDESEVFIVNNEDDAVTATEFGTPESNKSLLDTSHVSVVTVGEEIRVKDSSHAKIPLSHSSSCEISATIEALNDVNTEHQIHDGADDKHTILAARNKMNGQLRHVLNRDDDVSIIVNKKKTRPRVSPDSSVGSMDSRTHSECGSMRSSVGVPSPAATKSIDRSDAESIATTNSHDSSNHGEEEPVIIRRTKPERSERSKEELELRNLRKKTRKRTRKFEIDGVQVTTTTSKVIYGDDENGKIYDDHIFRKQELRELKMLQKQEKKQFLELQVKEQGSKEQQERRFDQERIALERTYEADMDALARQHRQLVEKTEQQQEADLRATSKKIRAEQERDLKLVSIRRFQFEIGT